MRRLLPLVLLVVLGARAAAAVDPADAALALPIELAGGGEGSAHVDLPPSLFAHTLHGAEDVVVVDATGERQWSRVLTRDADAPGARSDLEPRLVSQSASRTGLALLFDLRVRSAPGLVLELDLSGAVGTPLHVSDTDDPRAGPWEEIPFVASESTEQRLAGRATVPAGAGKRFVRVVVPTREPERVRLVRAAATITRHRLLFRPEHGTAPFTLLAGLRDVPGHVGPEVSDPAFTWDSGAPAHVARPDWLSPLPGFGASPGSEPGGGGRPFPWAESVATVITLALTIWAVLLRKER